MHGWTGIMPSNMTRALSMTRQGAAGRTARYIYATALAEAQAGRAVGAALSRRPLPPGRVPYVGQLRGFDDDFGGLNPFDTSDEVGGGGSGSSAGIVGRGTGYSYSATSGGGYVSNSNNQSAPASDSGSSWSDVFSTFFGNIGLGVGQRIAGRPTTPVPLPTTGPSMGTVLGIAALVGIPAVFLLTRKG